MRKGILAFALLLIVVLGIFLAVREYQHRTESADMVALYTAWQQSIAQGNYKTAHLLLHRDIRSDWPLDDFRDWFSENPPPRTNSLLRVFPGRIEGSIVPAPETDQYGSVYGELYSMKQSNGHWRMTSWNGFYAEGDF